MTPLHVRLTLPPDPSAAATARRALAPLLRSWDMEDGVHDDLLLVVTELVSNAVRHCGFRSPLAVGVSSFGDEVVVTVQDGSPVAPVRRTAGPDAEGGRGLALVDALTARWWVDRVPSGGKCVSAVLQVRGTGPAPARAAAARPATAC